MTCPTRLTILLMVLVTACAEKATITPPQPLTVVDDAIAEPRDATLVLLSPAELQFGEGFSTAVITNAQKFVLPIPALVHGGEPLVYPANHSQAGQPILDYQGRPIGERGLVFVNQSDRTVQAVAGDGDGVIIINEVTAEQAEALHQYITSLQPILEQLTLSQLQEILTYARDQLGLGDMYNSTRTYIETNMSAIATGGEATAVDSEDPIYGFKKRDNRDVGQAVYVPGAFRFQGPAVTPQTFTNGGVIVQQGGSIRGVQPEIFIRTYRLSNGQPITSVDEIATQMLL